jgi:hypothetical protein
VTELVEGLEKLIDTAFQEQIYIKKRLQTLKKWVDGASRASPRFLERVNQELGQMKMRSQTAEMQVTYTKELLEWILDSKHRSVPQVSVQSDTQR